jgi:mannose-1-phosphate guanylyltransferase
MNWAVIMAGGVGERFWPMSRRHRPKQLLALPGARTLIEETIARARPLFPPARIVVVTRAEQARAIRAVLPRGVTILAEPLGRNTAPCVALAAAVIGKRDPDAVMAVLPADSYIGDARAWRRVVDDALTVAGRHDALITVGIAPTSPHTGYGYIRLGPPVANRGRKLRTRFWQASRFVEKPDRPTARRFVAAGDYRWNAGMFVWSLAAITGAFARHQPALARGWRAMREAAGTARFRRVVARQYRRLKPVSIDHAILEKAGNVIVAHGGFQWDDLGDWTALARRLKPDAAGNVARGRFVGLNAADCVVASDAGHLIAVVGVRDTVIVHTPDATLVCRKNEAQTVRDLVKTLAAKNFYRRYL